MADRIVQLKEVTAGANPALGNVQPAKPARKLHAHQMLATQDAPIGQGRRILAWYSWGGMYDHEFGHLEISDGDTLGVNTAGGYFNPQPKVVTSRTLLELDGVPVTPGCRLAVHVTHLTSGHCMLPDAVDGAVPQTYTTQGTYGRAVVSAVWDDGATTETVTSTIDLAPGGSEPYQIDDGEGAAWTAMRERSATNAPGGFGESPASTAQWSAPGVTVDLTISAEGCARIVDLVVYEEPLAYGLTDADPAGPAHVYAESGTPRTSYRYDYPVEGASSGDKRYGVEHALAVAAAQETQLGPACWCYTSRREGHRDHAWFDSSDPEPWTTSGTSYALLGGDTTYSTESPQIEIGSLAYGRRFSQSDPVQVQAENGSCRIAFAAKWSVSAGTGTLALQSADYSSVSFTTTGTSYAWSKATTDLACGAHPLDGFRGLIVANNSASNDTRIRYAWCHYWPE